MAKKVELFCIAITQRTANDGERTYLMAEFANSEDAKGGTLKIIGDWGRQSELYDKLCHATVRGTTEPVVLEDDKRVVINPITAGQGWLVTDRSVPSLIQYRKRDADSPIRKSLAQSVRLVALEDLGEDPQEMVDAEMVRRCLTDEPGENGLGTWYRPRLGEDYSDYYVAECTWDDIRESLGYPPIASADVDDVLAVQAGEDE